MLSHVLRKGRQADPDGVEVIMSRQACEEAADLLDRATFLERRLAAVCRWLEINQPDVFSRGLWDAVEAATIGHGSLCWRCSRPQGYFETPCECGAVNPNVDLQGALMQQQTSSEV